MTKTEIKAIARVLKSLCTNPYLPTNYSYTEIALKAIVTEMGYGHILKEQSE